MTARRTLTARAAAKINLHLGVGAPRDDGFHPLATVYQAIGVHDVLELTEASDWTVDVEVAGYVDGGSIPSAGDNIIDLAAARLARHHGRERVGRVLVRKSIPVAGGLAGGSADAAAALVGLDRLWGVATPAADLLHLAAELGSDVPFALLGRTALGTGRGEQVVPVEDPARWWWVVVPSSEGLSTPDVYRHFDAMCPDAPAEPPAADELLRALTSADVHLLAAALHNDLQAPALDLRPDLRDVIADGERAGALRGIVSGSGPTCVFLCESRAHAGTVADRLGTGGTGGPGRPRPGLRRDRGRGRLMADPGTDQRAPRNLLNLERVSKAYGVRPLLTDVSLGVGVGQRIGVVGRNGDGKTTLLEVMAGQVAPDSGRVSHTRGLHIGFLHQADALDDAHTVREAVLQGRADHEWAAEAVTREVVEELLVEVPLDRAVATLSGGERRRCSLAALLLHDHDLLILDEPTNHLDVEAVAWLADHLVSRASALLVVTHDRWFLDAVCEATWEVHDGDVDAYEGGYAAFVLAKAERQRQSAASETRRRNLVRKELAWLRRGAPARTAKPRFRIAAANALIEDEPPPRDRLELQRFAAQRLGKDVVDLEDVDLVRGERRLLEHATWRLGPGDRLGLIGVNGAGKSSVLSLLSGRLAPTAGRVRRGRTVVLRHLTQELESPAGRSLDPDARVLATVESIRRVTRTLDGEIGASALLERFGFTGDRLTARLGDLSGGERRRFQLLTLLLDEPNVLLLDEPTNDLDIETLTVIEDFLDGWPGTLVAVSHDRYFLERVTDRIWALLGDGRLAMLPRGVDEYLEHRAVQRAASRAPVASPAAPGSGRVTGGERRGARGSQDVDPAGAPAGARDRAGVGRAGRHRRTRRRLHAAERADRPAVRAHGRAGRPRDGVAGRCRAPALTQGPARGRGAGQAVPCG